MMMMMTNLLLVSFTVHLEAKESPRRTLKVLEGREYFRRLGRYPPGCYSLLLITTLTLQVSTVLGTVLFLKVIVLGLRLLPVQQ